MTNYLTDPANVYYNALSVNTDPTQNIAAEYTSYRNTPIINNPYEYYMIIERFAISDLLLPIMILNDLSLSVTINNFRQYVPIINNSSLATSYGFIYDIDVFVQMINNTLQLAHTGAGVGGHAPIFLYDQDGRFSFLIDQVYVTNGTQIWLNTLLAQKLSSFVLYFNTYDQEPPSQNGQVFRLTYYPTVTNTYAASAFSVNVAYAIYKIDQPYLSTFLLDEINRIVVTTSQMPTYREYITGVNITSNQNSTLGVLFTLPVNNSFESNSQAINFTPEKLKLIDMQSPDPLNIIDFKIYFQTTDGKLAPVYIEPGKSFSITFAFVHKSINDNAYTFNKLNL